jgi:hypothetical protein
MRDRNLAAGEANALAAGIVGRLKVRGRANQRNGPKRELFIFIFKLNRVVVFYKGESCYFGII